MRINIKISLIIITLMLMSVLLYSEFWTNGTGIMPILNPRYSPDYAEDSNNSILIYQLTPGFSGLYDGYTVHLPVTNITINSDGFRDREYSIEKSNGTYRIIALGDSFMFGLGVELEDSYPKQLEAMLNKNKNSEIEYEVLNFGVPGYNTKQEVEMLKEKGLKYSPDALIIGYLSNDIEDSQLFQKIRLKLMDEYKNKSISEMEIPYKELDKRINSELEAYYRNITFDTAWQEVAAPLEELRNITLQKNIQVIILFYNSPNGPFFENQTRELELLSRRNGWLFINLAEVQAKQNMDKLILTRDDNHPNSNANMLYANYSLEKMKEAGIV